MDRNAAFRTLNLPENADQPTILKCFQERSADLRQRIGDAPAHLRSQFEEALRQAEEAYRVLALHAASTDWLPAADRVSVSSPPMANTGSSAASTASAPAFQFSGAQVAPPLGLMQRAGQWFFMGMVAALAGMVFFGLKSCEANKALAISKPKAEKVEKYEAILKNGKFKVKNISKKPFLILDYTVLYMKEDTLVRYEMPNPKEPIRIEPGQTKEFTKTEGTKHLYDGAVLFYALVVISIDSSNYNVIRDVCHDENGILLDPKF
jgi:hypothetical protein